MEWGKLRTRELAKLLDHVSAQAMQESNEGVKIGFVGGFPREVPLILGDAIHNLRTSLDLLACDVVRLNGKRADGVHFPFAGDAHGLKQQIARKNFDRASAAAQALLVSMGPYKGGNILLRGLHELDLMDKHQLIIPVASQETVNARIQGPGGQVLSLKNVGFANFRNAFVAGPGYTVEEGAGFTTKVSFGVGAPTPFPGRVVIETLHELADLVGGIIEAFEAISVRPDRDVSAPSCD